MFGKKMVYEVEFSPRARRDFKELTRETKERIKEAIEGIPLKGDIKKLKGFDGRFRLRVGDWRILYSLDKKERKVVISEILLRKEAYR